ncbi:hypothetical protein DUHN19_09740 [Helicobacter pylori]
MNHLLILYNPYYQLIQQYLSVLQEKSQVGFANLFVAKVIKVSKDIDEGLIPSYYKEKNLEVEDFFIISDLSELVREDFSLLRDQFLANFIAPNNHTYAIYGNNYVYPLPVRLKEERSYFLGDEKHYLSVYKSNI